MFLCLKFVPYVINMYICGIIFNDFVFCEIDFMRLVASCANLFFMLYFF